jgi:hypothetical protein
MSIALIVANGHPDGPPATAAAPSSSPTAWVRGKK